MSENYSRISVPLRKAILLGFFCFLFNVFVNASGLDRNIIAENEAKASRLSNIWDLNSINQAVVLFEETAKEWEKLGEIQKTLFCLNESAKLTQINSDYKTADRLLKKALKLSNGNNLLEEKTISLSIFSLISRQKGDKNNAQKYSQQALTLSQNLNSNKAKAYALFCSGMYEYYYGKLKNSILFFEQANISSQQTEDISLMSQILFYVGFAGLREGNPKKAEAVMNLALEQCEKYHYPRGIALSYFGIAYSNYFLNHKQKALELSKKSEALFPGDFEWLEKARLVNLLGLIHMHFGESQLAEINFQKAISYYEKVDYPQGKITTLTSLADIYFSRSDLVKAKETYNLATKLSIQIDDKFREAIIKEGLGSIEFKEKHYDAALKKYFEALHTYNDIGVRLPIIQNLIGNVYVEKKDYKTAREFYNSALATIKQTKDFFQLSETFCNLAKLNQIENYPSESLNNIRESIAVTETLYSDVANANLKRSYFSNVFERYELFINLLMKMQREASAEDYSVQALQASEKSRARSMLESLAMSEANFTKDADPGLVSQEKDLRSILNLKYGNLTDVLSVNNKSEADKLSAEINELENQLETIKATLKQNSPIYSTIKNPAPFDVAEFQKNILDDNSLLLEFSFGKDESYLWCVGKNDIGSFTLPARADLEGQIVSLRELLNDREKKTDESIEDFQARIKDSENKYWKQAQILSNDLFGQIRDEISGKRLIIVADGKLRSFPVAALPLPNSDKNEPLLLTNEVVYEPSALTLNLIKTNQNTKNLPSKNLLVFADPVFSSDDSRLTNIAATKEETNSDFVLSPKLRFAQSLNRLDRLFESQEEAETISEIAGSSKSNILSGFSATRERFLTPEILDYKILHFATHGFINEEHPEISSIVLSQFNEQGQNLEGLVRLQDIYSLNLSSDLVVLSACETGIGKEVKGEGLMSLNNAFLQVGAKSVLSSLWKVDDAATKELMKNFYGELATEKFTTSDALRRAQIKMWNNSRFKSPFYWAAFTMQGDYQNSPKLSAGLNYWIYLITAILVGLSAIYLVFRFTQRRKSN